jgi:putative membrane protein
MMKRILVCFFSLLVVLQIMPGVEANSLVSAFTAALVLSLINVTLKPVMLILTLPINILSLGLFTLVVNAICLGLTDWLVRGFEIYGFFYAILAAFVLSIVTLIVNSAIK